MREIKEMLSEIANEPIRRKMLVMHDEYQPQFDFFPASTRYHHSKKGDLGRHIKEVMNITLELYEAHPTWYDCTKDDAIIIGFIHDLEKIDGYTVAEDWQVRKGQMFQYSKRPYVNMTARVVRMCAKWGVLLSDEVMNAITFAHGAWSVDLSSPYAYVSSRDILPLGILIHTADMLSSQLLGYPERLRQVEKGKELK